LRLELRYKLVLGFVGVAVMSLALPPLLERLGISAWAALFGSLLLAVSAGSLLSHRVTRNIRNLRACTDLISKGDLTAEVEVDVGRFAPDETVDLARSIDGMLQSLRELVEHIQNAADQVAHSSRPRPWSRSREARSSRKKTFGAPRRGATTCRTRSASTRRARARPRPSRPRPTRLRAPASTLRA
jgi:methyl-accepting chemotaxis protein